MRARARRVAIQGELGSNSHKAATGLWPDAEVVPCQRSAAVLEQVISRTVACAVLPFENTLHGSVAEHYDLLLEQPVRLAGEVLVHVRHNVIAAPGVAMSDVRRVLSHPVALSQCRRWLAAHPEIAAEPCYDTAGSVKTVVEQRMRDTAGIAPVLAAEVYGGQVLADGVEDHPENFTRFHVVERCGTDDGASSGEDEQDRSRVNKLSVAFALEHRAGTLVRALAALAGSGVDLTRIESRPVHGSPWEYVFFVDMRCGDADQADKAIAALRPVSSRVRELGRYRAAERTVE